MARKPIVDPAQAANERILAERQARIDKKAQQQASEAVAAERIAEQILPESTATDAVEFLKDEFERKNFAEQLPTITRRVYGPHPLLDGCPEMKERLQKLGLEEYARVTYETIMKKGPAAVPDAIMRKGLERAIAKFGRERVAQAFSDRILTIPVREYEVEVDRDDPMMLADPLRDAVEKYGTPGMRPKFMSPRAMDVLGDRGYRVVTKENGDPVKVGTLIMGEIPEGMALARQRRYAEESIQAVRDQEEHYMETQERLVEATRTAGVGFRPLRRDEIISANATETEESLGQSRAAGFHIEREGEHA